jgi:hypothetical protein
MMDPAADSGMDTAPRTRTPGVWLILAGAGVAALGYLLGQFAGTAMALVGVGAAGVMIGAGYLAWPWSAEMVAANNDPNGFGRLWRLMPLFWKVWFVLSIVVGMGVMFAALILA